MVRHGVTAAMVTAALVLGSGAAATAQERGGNPDLVEVKGGGGSRGGFWSFVGMGAGGESNRLASEGGYTGALYKPTFTLRMGGTINPYVRLGGELFTWFNWEGARFENLGSVMAIAQVYPVPTAGLFVKGGGGIAWNGVTVQDDWGYYGPYYSDVGFGWTVGAGYEIPLSRKVGLVPTVDYTWHRYDGRTFETYYERVLNFGLSVSFQSGR